MGLPVRVNTRSAKIAASTKAILEKSLAYSFTFAISTRNLVFLDFDCRGEFKECYEEAKWIGRALVEQYGSEALIYRTPNGFHLIHKRWLDWKKIQKIIRGFIALIDEGVVQYLDKAHLEASLRRGYLTLRLNQLYLVCRVINVDGEARVYEQ